MSLPLAIAVTIIVIVGIAMILYVESQNVSYMQKANTIDTIRNNKEKETAIASYTGNTLDIKNPQNNPINIKYIRILDDKGNLIMRIPYEAQIKPFSNGTFNLTGIIPSQYLN
ncbi:MAG: hypothetical protein KGL95_14925 [Patescibacteria group bacterium]|nr:hypothetical protein [Patescibacteria group bacterium]